MKTKYWPIFLLLLLFPSCGDSPFLNEESPSSEIAGNQNLNSEGLLFNGEQLKIQPFWREGPFVLNQSRLLIVVTNLEGVPVSPELELNVMLWMPDMGHGSFPVDVIEIDEGVYEAKEIFFTMPGYWDIHFQLTQREEVLEEVKWPLNL